MNVYIKWQDRQVLYDACSDIDEELGEINTWYLDMPVVNIGYASNLLAALAKSLQSNGLDFNKHLSFLSSVDMWFVFHNL